MNRAAKKIILFASLILVVAVFWSIVQPALAADEATFGLPIVEETTILPTSDIRVIIARIIQVLLGLIGLVSVGMIIYAGGLWLMSGGEQEKIDQAKKTLVNWVIGLIIILLAYAITLFVFRILGVDMGLTTFRQRRNPWNWGSSALGGGIVESHYPARDATGIPRNTSIIVTFKENLDVSTLIIDPTAYTNDQGVSITRGVLDSENIKIFANQEGEDNAWGLAGGDQADRIVNVKTIDDQTFVFKPVDYLGSASQPMIYSVRLGEGLKKANGDDAFGGSREGFYLWQFEVSTYVDSTPPRVDDVFPTPGSEEYMNAVIQVNFNEAIDPTSIQSVKIYNRTTGDAPISGSLSLTNQYRTLEFISDSFCDVNSCGEDVFCLPAESEIKVSLSAATLANISPDAPAYADGLDGLVDVASNSLNGNGANGVGCSDDGLTCPGQTTGNHCDCAIGPDPTAVYPGERAPYWDNFVWLFTTNNQIMNLAPYAEQVYPGPTLAQREMVDLARPAETLFERRMLGRTLNSSNIILASNNEINGDPEIIWFYINWQNELGVSRNDPAVEVTKARVFINHSAYQSTASDGTTFNYSTHWRAGVKDIYQNCFRPASFSEFRDGQLTGQECLGGDSCCISQTYYPYNQECPVSLPVDWTPPSP